MKKTIMAVAVVVFFGMIIEGLVLGGKADRTLYEAKVVLAEEIGCEPSEFIVYRTGRYTYGDSYRYRYENAGRKTRVRGVSPSRYDSSIDSDEVIELIDGSLYLDELSLGCYTVAAFCVVLFVVLLEAE